MKYTLVIDREREEEVVVYAHERNLLTDSIEQLIAENALELVGYDDRDMERLELADVTCFLVEDGRVHALLQDGRRLNMRCRLYQLEESLPSTFVKIHQSCLANLRQVRRFDASLSGALKVIFKNGYIDYVSRRQIKVVKERLGVK